MQRTYYALITHAQGDTDYGVFFPEVENCFTSGDTVEHALKNARDVLELHFEEWQWAYPESVAFADLNIDLNPNDGKVVTIVPITVPVKRHKIRIHRCPHCISGRQNQQKPLRFHRTSHTRKIAK